MSTSQNRRKKQLEKKKKKRDTKRRTITARSTMSLAQKMELACRHPVVDCLMMSSLMDSGIGEIIVCRQSPGTQASFALFLVDRYCMGVKNCVATTASITDYHRMLERFRSQGRLPTRIDPSVARQIVEKSVEYARGCGIAPNRDYGAGSKIFGDIVPASIDLPFEFGQDGKPFYIAGPNESEFQRRKIVTGLHERFGTDGFDYVLPISETDANTGFPFDDDELDPFDDDIEFDDDPDEVSDDDDQDSVMNATGIQSTAASTEDRPKPGVVVVEPNDRLRTA